MNSGHVTQFRAVYTVDKYLSFSRDWNSDGVTSQTKDFIFVRKRNQIEEGLERLLSHVTNMIYYFHKWD